MSTIRILHVVARMNVGGTARYVSDLVRTIPDSALATGYVQESEIEDPVMDKLENFRVPHMGRKISLGNDFKAWLELRKIIKEFKPEIVHTHTFKAGLIGRLVSGDQRRVHTFHGHLFGDQSFSYFEKVVISILERLLARRTDLFISVGENVGSELRAAGIGRNMMWVSVPPGVDSLPQINKERARSILKLEPNIFIVGWMARMTSVKNPYLMLDVARSMPEMRFAMAGGGELYEDIQRSAPSNVSVIGWTDASTFWSAVDCAISTSDNEGMPIALIEAQLAGLPVVTPNVGSTSEVISHRLTGIVTEKDLQSLVEGLKEITVDKLIFESMGENSKVIASSKFKRSMLVSKHIELYKSLSGRRT